ncbi:MAG: winged helix-turn-helix transcriptional regulator, partial [Nitrososphaeraceae archaeon]
MDAKDVRIFCEIAFKGLDYDSFTDRRVSPLAIGRKLGFDEKTVRVRVKKMEDDGFIKYYQAMPSL